MALDREQGVFRKSSARAIAESLKGSAERSRRRKSESFRSAMSMHVFYINRAGKTLTPSRRRALERAKDERRELFGRQRRAAPSGLKAPRRQRARSTTRKPARAAAWGSIVRVNGPASRGSTSSSHKVTPSCRMVAVRRPNGSKRSRGISGRAVHRRLAVCERLGRST